MTQRRTWQEIKQSRPQSDEDRALYDAARRAIDFGKMAWDRRHERGLTLAEVARKLHTRSPMIERIELGDAQADPDVVRGLAEMLDLPQPSYLLVPGADAERVGGSVS